jgi:hypothetical protein
MLKTLAWALLTVLPFLLPNPAVAAFGARACARQRAGCLAAR